jgi:PQQ-dependent dehydrogenase (methanol/ethanol family)
VPLAGPDFAGRWSGKHVSDLQLAVSEQMPLNAPRSLSSAEYVDIVAYLLSKNGYKAGPAPLNQMDYFATLTVVGAAPRSGPAGPLPQLPATAKLYGSPSTSAPTDEELLRDDDANWLMYNKDYRGTRYSGLDQVNRRNAGRLSAVCAFQLGQTGWYSPSPVIYDGILYVTIASSTFAIDARTCRKVWQHDYVATEAPLVIVNRGVALYRGALYRTTPTGHLIALDLKTGKLLWDVWLSNTAQGYWLSAAPVAYRGKIIVGEAGADFGTPGHLYAFDAASGARLWTFDFIPTGNQPGADTWERGAATGGGSNWTSYAIDPEQNLIYAPVGNPAPDYNGAVRPGRNLYTDSVVALDADSGKLSWFAQQVPHDVHDWDTAAPPSLYDLDGRKFMAVGNKAGWLYVYDRVSHQLVAQSEVSRHENADAPPTAAGVHACPGNVGGVQWNGPAYSPADKALFVNSVEWCGTYRMDEPHYVQGALFMSGSFANDPVAQAGGWVRSFEAASGRQNWAYQSGTPMLAGVTPTAGELLLTGDLAGDFIAMDSKNGKVLYRFNTGGAVAGGISTYLAGGKQYVAVASGNSSRTTWATTGAATIFIFALGPD